MAANIHYFNIFNFDSQINSQSIQSFKGLPVLVTSFGVYVVKEWSKISLKNMNENDQKENYVYLYLKFTFQWHKRRNFCLCFWIVKLEVDIFANWQDDGPCAEFALNDNSCYFEQELFWSPKNVIKKIYCLSINIIIRNIFLDGWDWLFTQEIL